MVLQNITLIPFGFFEQNLLSEIADSVRQEYPFPVYVRKGHLDLSEYYDPVRRQYNGTNILKVVDASFSEESSKTMGLFSVDLFIPILTYIFGQAYLNGRCGIASLYRLSNERYGISADEKLLIDRFKKEVNHEIGHTFGLLHCHIPDCVMRASTYVEDIDQKNQNICPKCRNELNSNVGL
jgi:archaemetzincin